MVLSLRWRNKKNIFEMNKEQTKLADKAYKAFKALNDQYYKQRIQALVSVNEYGFAILIL